MTEVYQYKAFLSYSHKDKAAAEWLHKQLEKYRIPKTLTLPEGTGVDGQTIGRIFRDRDELPAAEDLTEAVRKALETSEYMVVLCSPNSAASRWVNKEIIEFKRLRGDRYVLPIIIGGEPFASDNGAPELECFPPAVRFKIAKTGGLSTLPAEPAAADARKDADGKPRAVLKLLAGILGVGLDQLIEREMRRKQKRVMAITAGAVAGMLVMAGLMLEAFDAREAADRSRAEAEDLVEFMLTDLREKLEPVGRLDVLDAVGEKVLSYHESQLAYAEASDDDIGRRARAYHMLGQMQVRRGNMEAAQGLFEQANLATGELLKRDLDNTQRIFEHAQSVFWVGNQAFERGQFQETEIAFRKYKEMADRLVELEPDKVDWLIEQAYGNNNLGDLYMRGLSRPREAIPYIKKSIKLFEAAREAKPESHYLSMWVAMGHSTLSNALRRVASREEVSVHSRHERRVLDGMLSIDEQDLKATERLLYWFMYDASRKSFLGDVDAGSLSYAKAAELVDRLLEVEPNDSLWMEDRAFIAYYQVRLFLDAGQINVADRYFERAREYSVSLMDKDASTSRHRDYLKFLDAYLGLYLIHLREGGPLRLADLDSLVSDFSEKNATLNRTQRGRWLIASIYKLKIQILLDAGKKEEANTSFNEVWELINADDLDQIPEVLASVLKIATLVDRQETALRIRQVLLERGYLVQSDKPDLSKNQGEL